MSARTDDESMQGNALDAFDIRKSLEGIKQACRGHKLIIFAVCLLCVGIVAGYVIVWPPVYQASVMLAADSEGDYHREDFYRNWNVFRKEHLPDEARLLVSAPVLEEVVEKMHLTYDDVYHPFMSHLTYLWTESRTGRMYRGMKSRLAFAKEDPYAPSAEEIDHARTIHDFQRGVRLEPVPDTNIGRLTVRGPSARVAEVANSLVHTYLDQRRLRHVNEADEAYNSLSVEVDRARSSLADKENELLQYHQENGILLEFEKDKEELSHLLSLQASVVDQQSTVAGMKEALAQIQRRLKQEASHIVNANVYQLNSLRQELEARLAALEVARSELLEQFRPGTPEVREVEAQIATLRNLIAQEEDMKEYQTSRVLNETYEGMRQQMIALESELKGEEASLAVKIAAVRGLEQRVKELPVKMKVSRELQREREIFENTYTMLQDKLMTAAASKAAALSAPPSIRVVEWAMHPQKAVWPKTTILLLVAAVVGLGAGISLAMLIDVVYARVDRRLYIEGAGAIYATVGRDRRYVEKLYSLSRGKG